MQVLYVWSQQKPSHNQSSYNQGMTVLLCICHYPIFGCAGGKGCLWAAQKSWFQQLQLFHIILMLEMPEYMAIPGPISFIKLGCSKNCFQLKSYKLLWPTGLLVWKSIRGFENRSGVSCLRFLPRWCLHEEKKQKSVFILYTNSPYSTSFVEHSVTKPSLWQDCCYHLQCHLTAHHAGLQDSLSLYHL